MSQHLVITAVGSDRAGIGNQVIHLSQRPVVTSSTAVLPSLVMSSHLSC
ncbi:hypothetical protein JCM19236_5375 [Vibrio sp. JCM 19236]|nr:hypothetical protein JCM19236_5375 [Vibrio sp. JCM 19236]